MATYIYKSKGYYLFKRRIPHSKVFYSFSLQTKNAKIAHKIAICFLSYANPYFAYLKTLPKLEIYQEMEQILEILNTYKQNALQEYSMLEAKRHNHFKHKIKDTQGNIKSVDGAHPESIKHWLSVLQDATYGDKRTIKKYFKDIVKRTDIDLSFYRRLNDHEKSVFELLLLKTEADILKEDLCRANVYFGIPIPGQQSIQSNTKHPYTVEKEVYVQKFIDFRKQNVREEKNISNDIQAASLMVQASNKLYFEMYTEEDFDNAFKILQNLPAQKGKVIEIYRNFENDYAKIANYAQENNLQKQSERTMNNKFKALKRFVQYLIDIQKVQIINHFENMKYTKRYITHNTPAAKKGVPFLYEELKNIFEKSPDFSPQGIKKTLEKKPERYFVTLLALYTGCRINEICGLNVQDIKYSQNGHFYYINIIENENRSLKTKNSMRKVPLNGYLMRELGLKRYIESVQKKGEKRLFYQLSNHKSNGYATEISRWFNNKLKCKIVRDEDRFKEGALNFHSFRHTLNTRLYQVEVDLKIRSLLTGHTTSGKENSVNTKVYTHETLQDIKKAIQKLKWENVIDFSHIKKALKTVNFD
jgi:integrase